MEIALAVVFLLVIPVALVITLVRVQRIKAVSRREFEAFQHQAGTQLTQAQAHIRALESELSSQQGQSAMEAQRIVDLKARYASEAAAETNKAQKLESELKTYRPIQDLEERRRQLLAEERQADGIVAGLRQQIETLRAELAPLELDQYARDFGLYEAKYDFGSAATYKARLEDLRRIQKELIKKNGAVQAPQGWTINGNAAAGRKMLKEIAQLQVWAFNGETEALIQRVRFDNVKTIEARIVELWRRVNVLDGETGSQVTHAFLDLKLQELYLVHEYQEKRQAELEEQRAIREQMREEERAQKELEKAQSDAQKEEQRFASALEKARREVESATGAKHDRLQEEIVRLSTALAEAQARKERALSQAQQTRVGHVYVISNIGSFGEHVYKIGMTRRLEPMDRVKELGDASVPFAFDVHAIIYSEDAPKLETELHRAFSAKRLNQVNLKKEFFRVTLEEIQTFVNQHHGQIEFTLAAEAPDYRKSQAKGS